MTPDPTTTERDSYPLDIASTDPPATPPDLEPHHPGHNPSCTHPVCRR